ncbi:hypothetical protein TNIN_16891 [Trichonephila inaurata madagascariensis]|uniref:Uncharacterized protein n=1 Tax=Trichonephila inaurata madagascariensis TaxID=2747483 RepID=A0A8X7CF45_9ARAC|nr:hypothetical protein TNIN_16891 [Trichonephila inaurata madagascariensis]
MSSTPTTTSGNVGRASRATAPSFRPLIGPPISRGNDTSRKVSSFTPFCLVRYSLSNTLACTLVLLTCTLRLSDEVEMCVGHSDTLLNPFTGHRKA